MVRLSPGDASIRAIFYRGPSNAGAESTCPPSGTVSSFARAEIRGLCRPPDIFNPRLVVAGLIRGLPVPHSGEKCMGRTAMSTSKITLSKKKRTARIVGVSPRRLPGRSNRSVETEDGGALRLPAYRACLLLRRRATFGSPSTAYAILRQEVDY